MRAAAEQVRIQAEEARQRRLRAAAQFVSMHCDRPLFSKRMKLPGSAGVVVRVDLPGVLRVYDPVSGELLAESLPGQFDHLAPRHDAPR